jgi:hypothetical protein
MQVNPLTNLTLIYSPDYHDPITWDLLSERTREQINNRIRDIPKPAPKSDLAGHDDTPADMDDETLPF